MNFCDFTSVTIQTAFWQLFHLQVWRILARDEDGKGIKMHTLHIAAQMAREEQQFAFHASSRYHNLTQLTLGDS